MDKINKDKVIISIKYLLIILILLITFLFLNHNFSFFIPCPFHEITHLYCPGCGVTRMILSILKLEFYQAFRYNPFLFTLAPFFIIYFTIYYINWLQNKSFKISKKIWTVLLISSLIFMTLRNIPCFDYLKPTVIK